MIRGMFAAPERAVRRAALTSQRDALTERIAELQRSLELVRCALECEHEDIATCPHFRNVLAEIVGDDLEVGAALGRIRPGHDTTARKD